MKSYTIFNHKDHIEIKPSFWAWLLGYKLTINKSSLKKDVYISDDNSSRLLQKGGIDNG